MGGSKMQNLKESINNIMKCSNQHEQRVRWRSQKEEAIQRCLNSLIHTLTCREGVTCRAHGCRKMKIVVEHTKTCPRKTSNFRGCVICTQLMNLCFYHSRQCRKSVCNVPFCRIMKKKLQAMNEQHAQKQSIQTMKPAYQFPIPPLRPLSISSIPSSVANDRSDGTSEPMPKRKRSDIVNAQPNSFERLLEQFNAQSPHVMT